MTASSRIYRLIALVLCLCTATVVSSTRIHRGFSASASQQNIESHADSAFIAARDTAFMHVFADSLQPNGEYRSDALMLSPREAVFLDARRVGAGTNQAFFMRRTTARLTDIRGVVQDTLNLPPKLISNNPFNFLNITRGKDDSSLILSFSAFDSIVYHGPKNNVHFKGATYNSLIHVRNNLFVAPYKVSGDNNNVPMRRIRMRSGTMTFDSTGKPFQYTLLTNPGAPLTGYFSNVSGAADLSSRILLATTRGADNFAKILQFNLVDTLWNVHDNMYVDTGISDIDGVTTMGARKFPDVPVVSYADGKFAALYYKSSGVYLCTLSVTGGGTPHIAPFAVTNILPDNRVRSMNLVKAGNKVFAAWRNYGTGRIEVQRFPIIGVDLSTTADSSFFVSAPSTVVDTGGPELGFDIDTAGNVAAAWGCVGGALHTLWMNCPVRYTTATWVSPVHTLPVSAPDSVLFWPGGADTALITGAIALSLRCGTGTDTAVGWTAWTGFGTRAALTALKGPRRNYQLRAQFSRAVGDSIKSPLLRSLTVNWNTQPGFVAIDSLFVGGARVMGASFEDTIDAICGIDTVDAHMQLHDADSTDQLYVTGNWPLNAMLASDQTIASISDRRVFLRFVPPSAWDTVCRAQMTIIDSTGWRGVDSSFVVRYRKAAPVITGVVYNGSPVLDGSRVPFSEIRTSTVSVFEERTVFVPWNRLSYRFVTSRFDTTVTDTNILTFFPSLHDTAMHVIVYDAFGASDTLSFALGSPQLARDSARAMSYIRALDTLASRIALIVGSGKTRTLTIPLYNEGNDPLIIDSIAFGGSSALWLQTGIDTGGYRLANTNGAAATLPKDTIGPGAAGALRMVLNVKNLSGDGLVYDTVRIRTNDPVCLWDTIALRLEYNDLPRIVSLASVYLDDKPFPAPGPAPLAGEYSFPPHSRIVLSFSEAMDTASVAANVQLFSHSRDSLGHPDTLQQQLSWNSSHDVLTIRPVYVDSVKKGIIPLPQFFLPTDTVSLLISPGATDTAHTPSSPNYIDIARNYKRSGQHDTSFAWRVDSISFHVADVSPADNAPGIVIDSVITVNFSSPLFPGSISTSKKRNTSLVVFTRDRSGGDTLIPLEFDTVKVSGSSAVFVPARSFFYGDSVFCRYRAATGRDTMGYPVDMSGDGIPLTLFNAATRSEDLTWSFGVAAPPSFTVSPPAGELSVALREPIVLSFSGTVDRRLIDVSRSNNHSLRLTSTYSEGTVIGFDSVRVERNRALFYPARRFFFSDTVRCEFGGYLSLDSTQFSAAYTNNLYIDSSTGTSWRFSTLPLTLVSFAPESASGDAGIHETVSMTFSGPVSADIFDTSLADPAANRSFAIRTSYSEGHPVALGSISFSPDSATVSVTTRHPAFSFDSVSCSFAGFAPGYSYVRAYDRLPLVDSTKNFAAFNWFYFTRNDGFYVYPNPYKPGVDKRHVGIRFKNLHVLRRGCTDVQIRIYSIMADLVWESRPINFREGDVAVEPLWPQLPVDGFDWWDPENNAGHPLASGVYLYAVYDMAGKMLVKDKLMIVR